jgi:tetratricopeptide (TPR) repeat protein
VRFISLLLLTMLVAGCAVNSRKVDTPPPISAEAPVTVLSSILPEGPATPDPYLQKVPSISRATQQQFAAALAAMERQEWTQAAQMLEELARANPRLSGIHLNAGLVYRAQGDMARAEAAFEQALAANDQNLDVYNELAILKRQQGAFAEAERLYQRALAVWPYHAPSHRNLAILYDLYLGQEQQALAHYLAYQQLLGEEDRQLTSWIADLQRRVNAGTGQ